jgi:hypothetical protein
MSGNTGRLLALSGLELILATAGAHGAAAQTQTQTPSPKAAAGADGRAVSEVVVTASRQDLLGKAVTASQGTVTQEEIKLRPIYRIGEFFETVPGLVVTQHSGEGKANQYLMRGFNLDHGTDFASFIDDMPVNRPTNTHGQGYSDQNFLMPQIAAGVDYTKGPYYAEEGDMSSVGSAHVRLVDDLPGQVSATASTFGDSDFFVGGTDHIDADDRVWAAAEVANVNGPWTPGGGFDKVDLTARFSHGTFLDGYSLTGMYYRGAGRMETDQSITAVQDGMIGRYGTLDPSDASFSERFSLSGRWATRGDDWQFSSNVYAIRSRMTLWNDFTHYLFDEVNGDQEQQTESRTTLGTDTAFTYAHNFGAIETTTTVGLQDRYDDIYIDRRHTHDRHVLDYCELANADGTEATPYVAVNGACSADLIGLNDLGVYVDNTTHWTSWLRTVLGLREEDYSATDHSLTLPSRQSGSQALFQPKGSLILGPWFKTELYVSAGEGFHSDDTRGVFHTVPYEGGLSANFSPQLLASTTGEEVGLRTDIVPKTKLQFAIFQQDFTSEQQYDQDQGEDQASAPSRRLGVELSGQYRPFKWIELNTDLSFAKARYVGSASDLANEYGISGGPYIANAPNFVGAFGVLVDNLGPWSGSVQWRDLGPYPLLDGPKDPGSKGYSEVNLEAGRTFGSRFKAEVSIFNLLNTKAYAMEYDYTDRLTPGGPEITGPQVHPMEPISARFTLTAYF